jgi:assimilatory nitrate reductase catalytic subunit
MSSIHTQASQETRSTCPYCGVGCGVIIETQGQHITCVRGDPEHPANFGRLCSKGSTLHLSAKPEVTQQTRLLTPQVRSKRTHAFTHTPWDAALQQASDKIAQVVADHGPDAVGFYVSGQLLTEDYYVFNKLVKGLIGTNNIDTNSRLCMSSAVAGYKITLGADAPPACYDDIDETDCLFIAGSNAAYAHPILFRRIENARAKNPELKIIVADPRKTDTASAADLHLALKPGTDVMLFHGMLRVMLLKGWTHASYIQQHTDGFEDLVAKVMLCTPAKVQDICGISPTQLHQAAEWFATSKATLSLYCQGLNQSSSGTAKNASLVHLHLATGHIGKPGAGPFSLTGQPNAMGGREVGGLANLLSAHRDLGNPAHRAEVARLWGLDDVPAQAGQTAVEMFQAAAEGHIKVLWIACTNPAQSMPDQRTVRKALERAELVVVQEAFATAETCAFADILLPATPWGEKEGTVTNSERRITRVRAAVPPSGQAQHDWQIVLALAERLGQQDVFKLRAQQMNWAYASPEAIWNEHRESTRGRDLDITGLSYAQLERQPEQWPMPEGATTGTKRLYEDGQFPTANGKAKFVALDYVPVAEPCESRFPFSFNTGRLRDQWHGMTRTGTIAKLFGHVPEPSVQLHPQDMLALNVKDGELVHLTSKRGSIVAPAQTSHELAPQQAFMAMHWGPAFISGRDHQNNALAGVNAITTSAFCPSSKQPELKHAAVKILKAELPWKLLAMAWLPSDQALTILQSLRQQMVHFEFASCVPFAEELPLAMTELSATSASVVPRQGVLFRAASSEAPDMHLVQTLEALLQLDAKSGLRYADPKRSHLRSIQLNRSKAMPQLEAFVMAGDTSAEAWLKTLLQTQQSTESYGRRLLMTGQKPPVALKEAGQTICTCVGVKDVAIAEWLQTHPGQEAAQLAGLKNNLKGGTQCGYCVPQLKRIIALQSADKPKQDTASLAI